jgi:hypothetical protein
MHGILDRLTSGLIRNVCEGGIEERLKQLGGLSGEPALGDAVCDQAKPIAKEHHAGCLMRAKEKPVRKAVLRKKGSRYADLLPHLSKLWRAMGRVGGRKMRAAMLDWLPFYEADVPSEQRL